MIIYELKSPSGKIYIGKTKNLLKRIKKHEKNSKNRVSKLYSAIKKYGIENFEINILEECLADNVNEREVFWINKKRSYIDGYNMTKGGDGGNTYEFLSEKRKKEIGNKLSKFHKGKHHLSKECRKHLSSLRKGKTFEEIFGPDKAKIMKEKLRKTNIMKGITPPIHHNGNGGHKHTQDSKDKMSKARKGKKYEEILGVEKSEKTKEKLRKRFVGNKNPQYVNFKFEDKIILLNELSKRELTMKDCEELIKLSSYKIRKFFQDELSIDNFQKFKREYSIEEQKKYFKDLLYEFNES